MTDFCAAFPDLNFWQTANLIAEGDDVVGQWEGGTHTGSACRTPAGSFVQGKARAVRALSIFF
jgi:SnoaL-like polyketide cyclase